MITTSEITCPCGTIFTAPKTAKRKYCSPACGLRFAKPSRQVTCQDCGATFLYLGRGGCKRCEGCRKLAAAARARVHAIKAGKIANPGVGSGGVQWGEANHQWKAKHTKYRNAMLRAFAGKSAACSVCEMPTTDVAGKSDLLVHHLDHNRLNGSALNLVWVCKACHQNIEHRSPRDDRGRYSRIKIAELSEKLPLGQLEPKAADTQSGATTTGQGQLTVPISQHEAATPAGENIVWTAGQLAEIRDKEPV